MSRNPSEVRSGACFSAFEPALTLDIPNVEGYRPHWHPCQWVRKPLRPEASGGLLDKLVKGYSARALRSFQKGAFSQPSYESRLLSCLILPASPTIRAFFLAWLHRLSCRSRAMASSSDS